jgi:hypothetical protein
MLDPRLCFFRRQQFYKCGSFEIKEPALVHQAAGGELTATHYMRDFAANQIIVLRMVPSRMLTSMPLSVAMPVAATGILRV